MRRSLIAAGLALCAGPASAQSVWDGPGPRACDGRCDFEWAVSQLPLEHQEDVLTAAEMGRLIEMRPIVDGDVMSFMTYYDDGPVADTGTTIADLDEPEFASGWSFDWGYFVLIDGCQNYAVIERPPSMAEALALEGPLVQIVSGSTNTWVTSSSTPGVLVFTGTPDTPSTPETPIDPVPPAVIPLPATMWMLLASVAALLALRKVRH